MVAAILPLLAALGAEKHRAVAPAPPSVLTAVADAYSVVQGKVLAVSAAKGVLANDIPQGKASIALLVSNPPHGALTFNPDGSFTYTNDGTGATSDAFTYRASDGTALSNIVTVTISIVGTNAITAVPDAYALAHGASVTVAAPGVLGNDVDPNGSALSATALSRPAHGTLAFNPNGSFVYTHDGTNTTSDAFTYRASDGVLTSGPATVSLTIGADVPPTVASQTYSATQNTPLTVAAPGVLTGAFDPDSPTITAVQQTAPGHGTVVLNPDGSFVYTPAAGYTGADSFTYRGSDGISISASSGTASIAIAALPLPSAVADHYVATTAALTIAAPGVLGNDALNGAAIISFGVNGNDQSGIGHPAVTSRGGQITLNADGSFVYNAPSASFAGDDTFQYIVGNATGTSTATVTITVAPINPKCPPMTITPATLPAATAGAVYPAVSFSQSGGAAPVTWSAGTLPPGLSFSNAGVLSGTPSSIGTFNVTITATDANGCTAVAAPALTVSCPALAIAATALPDGTIGAAYAPVTLSQSGGTAPIAWSLAAGALPAGISLSNGGVLAGTPSQSGAFTFTVKATDANGCSGTRGLSLAIDAKCPPITIAPSALPNGAPNTVYPAVSFTQSGGAQPVTWTSGALPPGMSFSSAGVLFGTPSIVGTFNVTVTATDANGCTQSATLPLTVTTTCAAAMTISVPAIAATAGTAMPLTTLSVSNAAAPVTWSVVFGALPPGLTLSAGGVLSGTPTQSGAFAFTVQVRDANGCTKTKDVMLTVASACPAITISPATLPGATPNAAYPAVSFSQSGGAEPVTWTAGALPPGMNFSSAGVLSGTPASAGVFNLSITATDANRCAKTIVVQLAVGVTCSQGMTISVPPLSAKEGVPSALVTLSVSNAAAPMTWSVVFGALPNGMTLSPAGVLSGTPSQSGTFTFTVQAADANGCATTKDVTLTVDPACPAIAISPSTLPGATPNVAYAARSFSQSGGVAPVTWTAGALPPGMSFSSAGVLSGTPASAGVFNLSITATDANGCAKTIVVQLSVGITCSIAIAEPALSPGKVGVAYTSVLLSATGGTGAVAWSVVSGALPPGIGLSPGGLLSGTPAADGTFNFQVQATDANGCAATRDLSITVASRCPTIIITAPVLSTGALGSVYPAVSFSQSGGAAPITWTAGSLPPGMTFTSGGVLSGTPTAEGKFDIAVTATDANGCAKSIVVTLTIANPCPIAIATSTLAAATTGVAYSVQLAQSGGAGTVAWSVAGGSLPNGITLSAGGLLAGTSTQSGIFNFTVKAVDANACAATKDLSLTVSVKCPAAIAIGYPAGPAAGRIPDGTAGVLYPAVHFTPSGNSGAVTWTWGTLPTGMTFSSGGDLSGTPTVHGTFTITVMATDANGCTGSVAVTLFLACPTISIQASATSAPSVLPHGTKGTAYTQVTFSQTGGLGTIVWRLADTGALPAGMSFSSDGKLTGTPAANGTRILTVQAIDDAGCVGTATYTLIIDCQSITVTNPATATGTVKTPFTATFTQSGGIGPVTFSAPLSSLPAGLTLLPTGVLTGTPTQNGTFDITVTATDAGGCSGSSIGYRLVIACGTIAVTNPSVTTATTAAPFSQTFSASGAVVGDLQFTASAAIPGLTLSPTTGVLSGTPTQTGTFPVTVTAKDANQCPGIGSVYNLTVSCLDLTVTPPPVTAAIAGSAFPSGVTFLAGRNNGTTTFAVASGALPAGMSLATNGTLQGTPTQTGSFTIAVKATDANGCTGPGASYTFNVGCPANISVAATQVPTTATINTSYFSRFTASGGIAPLAMKAITTILPQTPAAPMSQPGQMAFDRSGNLYIANINMNRIDQYVPGTNTVNITKYQGLRPEALTFDAAGTTLYVADTGNNRIVRMDGTTPTVLVDFVNLNHPAGIAVEGSGSSAFVYIADTGNNAIKKYNVATNALSTIVSGGLSSPHALLLLSDGLYVADTNGGTLRKYNKDGTSPQAVVQGLDRPVGLAVDGGGAIYIAEVGGSIKKWASKTLTTIPTAGLAAPNGVAVDSSGRVYIGDTAHDKVKVIGGPLGLNLSPDGDLTGIPIVSGTFGIDVFATDANDCIGPATTTTLTIGCDTVTVTPQAPANTSGTINAPYSQQFTSTGLNGDVTFSTSSALPNGVHLSSDGLLSGTPTGPSPIPHTFPIQVDASGAGCSGSSAPFNLTIQCQTITLTPNWVLPPIYYQGDTISGEGLRINQSNAVAPVSYAISGQPNGVGIDTSSGLLIGRIHCNATARTYDVTVTVTDANGCTGSVTFSFTVLNNPFCF